MHVLEKSNGNSYPRIRPLKSFANKILIPARQTALIFPAASLIEGVVDCDV
jgi:hypothetical protein